VAEGEAVQIAPPDPVPAASTGDQRRSRVLRRYRKSIVLLVVAILTGVGALICFPTDSPVVADGGLRSVDLKAFFVPVNVALWLADDPARHAVVVTAEVVSNTPQRTRAALTMTVPATTWGATSRCSPQPSTCLADGASKIVNFGFAGWTKTAIGNQTLYHERVRVTIPGVGYNTAANEEYVSATLPNFEMWTYKAGAGYTRDEVPRTIALRIPGAAKYAWTSGPSPSINGGYASWLFTTPAGASTVTSGVSLAVQDTDSKLIFLAGALLGIAGGALVGAIQEAIRDP